MSGAAGAYAQLFALGLPWVSLHCGAMCGPIVAGLTSATPCKSKRIQGVAAYQMGRAAIYLPLGAVAGGLGHALEVRPAVGATAAILFACALTAAAVVRAMGPGSSLISTGELLRKVQSSPRATRLVTSSQTLVRNGSLVPFALAGTMLSALPCMLPAWVLGLAAGTGSPFHGAALMAGLLTLSAVPLAIASVLLPGKAQGAMARLVPTVALLFSAGWLVLGALATLHVLPHGRLELFERTVTFW